MTAAEPRLGKVAYLGLLHADDVKPAGWLYLVRYEDKTLSGRRIVRGAHAPRIRIGEERP